MRTIVTVESTGHETGIVADALVHLRWALETLGRCEAICRQGDGDNHLFVLRDGIRLNVKATTMNTDFTVERNNATLAGLRIPGTSTGQGYVLTLGDATTALEKAIEMLGPVSRGVVDPDDGRPLMRQIACHALHRFDGGAEAAVIAPNPWQIGYGVVRYHARNSDSLPKESMSDVAPQVIVRAHRVSAPLDAHDAAPWVNVHSASAGVDLEDDAVETMRAVIAREQRLAA